MRNTFITALSLLLFLSFAGCKKKAEEAPASTEVAANVEASKGAKGGASETRATEAKDTEKAPEKPTDSDSDVIEKPFFYSVEGPNGESGSLLGTMHMGINASRELPKAIWDALDASSSLTIEADITDVKVAMGLMLPKGENLRDLLGDETWALLVAKVGEGTANMLLPMKPAAAASTIAIQGIKMTVPMDLTVVAKAQAAKTPVHFLEDAAFQLAMLDKIMTVETIKEMLTNPEAVSMQDMLDTYRAGDAEALIKIMQDDASLGENADEKMEALLFARNENWIPKLEARFAAKGAFIAVGAAHLVGPRSVIELLEAKGYKIRRLGE